MKQSVSFGEISYHIIYPLIIIFVITGINKSKACLNTEIRTTFFLITSIGEMFLGEMIGGCLYFFSHFNKQSSEAPKIPNITKSYKIKTLFSQHNAKYTPQVILLILGLGGIDLIASGIYYSSPKLLPQLANGTYNLILFIQFYLYTLFSVFLLKQEMNLHHYVGIAINTLGAIIVLIPLFLESFVWTTLFVNLTRQCLNSLFYSLDKWLMIFKRVNPFLLLLLQGVFGFSVFIVLLIFQFSLCPTKEPVAWYCNDVTFFSKLDTNGIFFILIEFVRFIASNVCIIQTIYYYSPLHLLGTYAFSLILDWIIDTSSGKGFDAVSLVGYLIIAFGYAIYNEVIVLHFWGLDRNTKKMIKKRGIEDINMNMEMI